MKELTNKTWAGQQGWHHERLLLLGEHRCKVEIRRNSQSYARLHKWDGHKWGLLCTAPFPLWPEAAKKVSYVQKGITARNFDELVQMLMQEAKQVLGLPVPASQGVSA